MNGFNVVADAYLIKSGNKNAPVRVGGIITTEDRDDDGEIVKAVDWSYFTGGFGKIKYEHKEFKGPDAVIGFPTKLIKKGKTYEFEGELVPFDPKAPEDTLTRQQKLAKSTVSLLEHIEDHNKRHPNNPQRAGWSIEGEYLELNPKTKVAKAKIVDVVFTTKPKNKKSLAEILHKSLEVGYGMTSDTQSGFGATRTESIEGNINHQKNSGAKKMKTKEQVFKSCLDKGMSKEAATKEANQWETEQASALNGKYDAAEKSLGNSKESFQKSLDLAKSIEATEIDFDVEASEKSLNKSLETDKDGNVEDIGKFLEESQRVQLSLMKGLQTIFETQKNLAKSIEAVAEGFLQGGDHNDYVLNIIDHNTAQTEMLRKGLITLVKGLAKSGGFSTQKLVNLSFEENNGDDNVELTKSQTLKVLDKMIEDGEISDITAIGYESTGQFAEDSMNGKVLEKAKKMELIK